MPRATSAKATEAFTDKCRHFDRWRKNWTRIKRGKSHAPSWRQSGCCCCYCFGCIKWDLANAILKGFYKIKFYEPLTTTTKKVTLEGKKSLRWYQFGFSKKAQSGTSVIELLLSFMLSSLAFRAKRMDLQALSLVRTHFSRHKFAWNSSGS